MPKISTPGRWLETIGARYGLAWAFGAAALLEATFVPLLIDALMLSFYMTGTVKLWRLVSIGLVMSVLGTMIFWIIGAQAGSEGLESVFNQINISAQTQSQILQTWEANWIVATFVAGLTAIPDPVAALLAGATGVNFVAFAAVLSLVFAVRFGVMALIVWIVSKFFTSSSPQAKRTVSGLSLIATLILALIGIGTWMMR